MKSDKKRSTDITRRELLKQIGKYGVWVPPTLVVATVPRAFAGSPEPPEPPSHVSISGTFSSTLRPDEFPYAILHYIPSRLNLIWCGPINSTFNVALTGLDPTQAWGIGAGLSWDSVCSGLMACCNFQVSGPDASRGTVWNFWWKVSAGAVTLGEALQVNFGFAPT